tara:strand:+ start:493 stop:3039 length:2547 start_codon:yes stop_codon:yes gene_type:complete
MAIAVVAGIAASGGAVIAAGGFAFIEMAAILGAFALGAGLSMVSRALMPKPSLGSQMSGTTTTIREPAATRQIVYGRCRVGGAIVFIDSTGPKNEYIHLVIAIAGHAIDSFEEVYFNDQKIWDGGSFVGTWGTYVHLGLHDGTQTTSDALLTSSSSIWTTDHKLLDTAYMYVRLKYNAKQFANGLPNVSSVIKGKKVYNPLTDTTVWSQNPALIVRDYLLDQKYGLAEVNANINSTSVTTAQNLCDEQITLEAGGTQSRYICDGVVNTGSSREDNIENLLSSMAGNLIHSGGQYFISGAAYVTPTITIDESVMVGAITIKTKQSRRSAYNGVKGVFLSEEENYIVADYPSIISSTYSVADGDPIYLDMPLPFTTNNLRAQRLAKLALLQSRQQTQVTIPCNLAALKFKAGDTIMVTNEKIGWASKVFNVLGYTFDITAGGEIVVNVDAMETAAAIYDWTSSDEQDFLAGGEIDLYDGRTVAAPTSFQSVASTTVNADGTIVPTIASTWVASDDVFVTHYDYQWSLDNSNWNAQDVNGLQATIVTAISGATYYTRVRAINDLGVPSAFVTANVAAIGDTDAPSGVTGLTATSGQGSITLSWISPADKDYSNAEVYRSISSGGTYTAIASVAGGYGVASSFVNGSLSDSTAYYYKVKAVDYSGNKSAFSAVASATTAGAVSPPRTDNGYVYYQTASVSTPSTPSATSYNYNTASLGGLTAGWGSNPVPVTGSDGKYWATSFTVVEAVFGGAQTIAFSAPFISINFDGLVTFTNLNNELANPSSTEITTISGGLIKTGTLDVGLVNVSGTMQAGFDLSSSASTSTSRMKIANDKIEIYEGAVLRVKLGNLA